jgi:hypothetical protein
MKELYIMCSSGATKAVPLWPMTKSERRFGRFWAGWPPNLRLKSLLWEIRWYKNREIGEVFGLSYSAVSRRVKVTKDQIERDKDFRKRYQQKKEQIKM